jgi:hypothetical protein
VTKNHYLAAHAEELNLNVEVNRGVGAGSTLVLPGQRNGRHPGSKRPGGRRVAAVV